MALLTMHGNSQPTEAESHGRAAEGGSQVQQQKPPPITNRLWLVAQQLPQRPSESTPFAPSTLLISQPSREETTHHTHPSCLISGLPLAAPNTQTEE